MDIYTKDYRILAEDVDSKERVKISSLLRFIQESSIAHTTLLGMGKEKTLDKGFLWIICKERILLHRLPLYDEEVRIVTSPGKTLHYFFPRRFALLAKNGEVLVQAESLWALMDRKDRHFIDPKENGITIDGEDKGDDIPLISSFSKEENQRNVYWKAVYSLCDINGHLNNASYLDFAMDSLPLQYVLSHDPKEISISFKKEIQQGKKVRVNISDHKDEYVFLSDAFNLKILFQ